MICLQSKLERFDVRLMIVLISAIFTAGAVANGRPSVTVYPCQQPPTLDGDLNESCWDSCAPLRDFSLYTGVAPSSLQTTARITYDNTNLYVGVVCRSEKPPRSKQTERDHPDLWRDDHIEISINPTPDSPDYYHLQVNTNGAWLDERVTGYEPRDPSWNIDLRVGVKTRPDGYNIELAIPFAGLGATPKTGNPISPGTGSRWGFNICRGASDAGELSSWSRVRGTFFAPNLFGSLTFRAAGPRLIDIDPLPTFPGSHAVAMTFLPTKTRELDVRVSTTVERDSGGITKTEQTIQCYSQEPFQTVAPIVVPGDARSICLKITAQRDKHLIFSTGAFPLRAQPSLMIDTDPLQAALAQLDAASDTAKVQKILKKGRQIVASAKQAQTERKGYFASFRPLIERWRALVKKVHAVNQELRRATIVAQTRLHDIAAGRKTSDYAILTLSPMTKVEQTAVPPGIVDGAVTIELARNEYESAQFTIWPFERSLEDVTVRVNDLVHTEKKGVILARDITLHLPGFIDCRPPQYDPDLVGSAPDPLLPYKPFSVPAGTHQPVWLTLHTSRVTPPGLYRGSIEVRVPNQPLRVLPFIVRVYDFLLERMHLTTAFAFFESEVRSWYGLPDPIPQDIRRRYYEFLLSYRLNPTNIYASEPRPRKEDIQFCLDRGMTAFNVKHIPRGIQWTKAERKKTLDFFDAYYPYLKSNHLLNVAYCYSFDEPNPEDYPTIRKIFDLLGSRYPGLRRATTETPAKELEGSVDIYVPLTSEYDAAVCRERQKAGDQIWWYVCLAPKHPYANFFIDYQGIDQRILFWQAWKYRVTGFLYYAINLWRSNRATESTSNIVPFDNPERIAAIRAGKRWPDIPWNSYTYTRHNGDGHLMYPGPDCVPYASVRLALIRDGIEDYEYFYLLQERLNRLLAKKNESPQVVALTDAASKILETPGSVVTNLTKYTHDPKILLAEREKVAELIERIDQKIRELK